jgi:hypothetical protein
MLRMHLRKLLMKTWSLCRRPLVVFQVSAPYKRMVFTLELNNQTLVFNEITWRWEFIAEMEIEGYRWQDLERMAQNRTRWRTVVSGICTTKVEDCRQWHMHHQGMVLNNKLSLKCSINFFIFKWSCSVFYELNLIILPSIICNWNWSFQAKQIY